MSTPSAAQEQPPPPQQQHQQRGPQRIVVLCDGTWQKRRSVQSVTTEGGVSTSDDAGDKWFTNVALLSRCIARSGVPGVARSNPGAIDGVDVAKDYVMPQTVFYQNGIGTSPYLFAKLLEGATGLTLDLKVEEAYSFVVDNFLPGDELFFFGFSRGAYTARTLAALINYVGVLTRQESADHLATIWQAFRSRDPSDPNSVAKAEQAVFDALGRWPSASAMNSARDNAQVAEVMTGKETLAHVELMMESENTPNSQGVSKDNTVQPPGTTSNAVSDSADDAANRDNANRGPCVVPPTIQVVGVWDCVGALGIPGSFLNPQKQQFYSFFDPMLAPNVRHAFHALALFEDRKDFLPTIWALPKRESKQDAARRQGQELKQCWFQGSHSDVGGGHPWHGLSDISLAWMIAQLVDRPGDGAALLDVDVSMARTLQDVRLPWARQPEHPSRAAIEFQASRYVNGWTVPTQIDDNAVWRNVVNREATFESIHHSVVVGQQYDSETSVQFELLRKRLPGVPDRMLDQLWRTAKDPSSLSKTERLMQWSAEECKTAFERKTTTSKDVPLLDTELLPARPPSVPKGVWTFVTGLAFAPLKTLSFVSNWKIPILQHKHLPQDNLSPPKVLNLFNKLNHGHQQPSTPKTNITNTPPATTTG